VKVLDFGLAKAMDPTDAASGGSSASHLAASPTLTLGATVQGVILGSAAYMAPEQARGLAVDKRADIWAFGVVLYEMLVGRRLFEGELVTDVLASVITREIDLDALPEGTPAALRRLLRRCLERKPKNRLHDIADARLVIDDLLAGRDDGIEGPVVGGSVPMPAGTIWIGRLGWLGAGIALGVTLALAFGLGSGTGSGAASGPEEPELVTFKPLVAGGAPSQPAISRDGGTLAFTARRGGESQVWIKDLATGSESVLARSPAWAPEFSPDGTSLLFLTGEGERADLYRLSLATREARLVVRDAGPPAWSPDGRSVAFVRYVAEPVSQKLVLLDLDSGEERVLLEYSEVGRFLRAAPSWSPDGRRLALSIPAGQAGVADRFGVFELASGKLEEFELRVPGLVDSELRGRDWISNDRLVLLLSDGVSGSSVARSGRVALFDLRTGTTRSVVPVQPVAGTVVHAGGGSVVVGLGSDGGWSSAAQVTQGPYTDRQPAYSPDGRTIVFVSDRSGNRDLWRFARDTGELRRLTDHEAIDWDPALSADGERLVFSSNRSGRFQIWVAEADGGSPQRLTDVENAQNPTWTADGEWIVYTRQDSAAGENGLWKIRSDGSEATRLLEGTTFVPETSPDGRWAVFESGGRPGLQILRLRDGELLFFPDLALARRRWSVERGSTYLWGLDGPGAIWRHRFDPETGALGEGELVATKPAGRWPDTLGVAPDGASVAVSTPVWWGQIVRIDGLTELEER
jgi:Tol biopolymer transport system component